MDKQRKTLNIIKIILIIIIFAFTTFAWFNNNPQSDVSDLVVSSKALSRVLISDDDGETWEETLNIDFESMFTFSSEITGDGITMLTASGKTANGTPYAFIPATSGNDFYDVRITFKSNSKTTLFLSDTSYVIPSAGTTYSSLVGTNVVRKTTGADFSRDLVAASVRVAFIENDVVNDEYVLQSEPKFIWAPNKMYKISVLNNSYVIELDSLEDQEYNYYHYVNGNLVQTRIPKMKDSLNVSTNSTDANGDFPLVSLDANVEKAVTIRIWIDGNDRDNVNAVKGGRIKIKFNFIGLVKDVNLAIPAVSANANTIMGLTANMEYSTDMGTNWILYNGGNLTFPNGSTVYVRYPENSVYFASNYAIVNF